MNLIAKIVEIALQAFAGIVEYFLGLAFHGLTDSLSIWSMW